VKQISPDRVSFTIDEAIQATGWDRNRLYKIIAEGRLKTFKHGRRRFVSAEALRECIRKLEQDAEYGRAV